MSQVYVVKTRAVENFFAGVAGGAESMAQRRSRGNGYPLALRLRRSDTRSAKNCWSELALVGLYPDAG
jgi:hypothetical protein